MRIQLDFIPTSPDVSRIRATVEIAHDLIMEEVGIKNKDLLNVQPFVNNPEGQTYKGESLITALHKLSNIINFKLKTGGY